MLVYAVLVIGTLGWAIWEIGFDWWQLAPRGGVIMLLGLWLLTPWIRRGLNEEELSAQRTSWGPAVPLVVAVLAALGVAGYSMTQDPQQISGELSKEVIAPSQISAATFRTSDWHQYGRTPYGQRYSPLKQITPENVSTFAGCLAVPDRRCETAR